MICETIKDLTDTLNRCFYMRKSNDPNKDVVVCNLCGNTEYTIGDMLLHIITEHVNETIPDVDPTE
jgi:hypothetical protein